MNNVNSYDWFHFPSHSIDWIVGDGAEACWIYAMLVQPALDDLAEAVRSGDPGLAQESAMMALRGCYSCVLVASYGARSTSSNELHTSIALSETPLAGAIRSLQSSESSDLADLEALARIVAERLRRALPFEMPEVRKEFSAPRTMRLATALTRIRKKRERGGLHWRR